MKRILDLIILTALCTSTFAQSKIKGFVVDSETNQPLVGASVSLKDGEGTICNIDGSFALKISNDTGTVYVSFLGYKEELVQINNYHNLGVIKLVVDPIVLNDIVIQGQRAKLRETPIAVSSVTALNIAERLGTQEFPTILKQTPGVHPNSQGGGWGDSEIYMRGFDNTNVAVMVNGIPVNDMESGAVYWSNWAGLSEVTEEVQTQRGIGANYVSSPSIGGTINIITRGISTKRKTSGTYMVGSNGYNKVAFSVASGILSQGWSFNLLGSRTWGDGYAVGTNFVVYNYFVNVAKRFNDHHQLSLTAFGAPQQHYSRSNALTKSEWESVKDYNSFGRDYTQFNPDFGFDSNGQRKTADYNKYHKPTITLNHVWQIDSKSSLTTSAYVSFGYGIAYSGDSNSSTYSEYDWYGTNNGKLSTTFRKPDGTFDYAAIEAVNMASTNGSELVMSDIKTNFQWYGLISTYKNQFLDCLNFTTGIDIRYYKGQHTNVLSDLYSGSYFIDPARKNIKAEDNAKASNFDWVNQQLHIGDAIHRDYDGNIAQEGVFTQFEYFRNGLSAFLAGSANLSTIWRYDRLYYDAEHARSEKINRISGSVKAGANYNFDFHNNIFLNVGYISKIPPFKNGLFMSANTSNLINHDAKNEQAASVELGYGFHNRYVNFVINAYLIEWMDKTMAKKGNMENGKLYYMNMTGVKARHMGIELETTSNPTSWLEIRAMLSLGSWKWDSDNVKGLAYDSYGQAITPAGNITTPGADDQAWAIINMKGIYVGGSAQTTAALDLTFNPYKGIRIGGGYTLYDRNYAYFGIDGKKLKLGKIMNTSEAWKIPTGGSLDLRASYVFAIKSVRFTVASQINNVIGQRYIEKAWNPSNISADAKPVSEDDVYFFYAQGRTWNVKLNIAF